MNVPERLQNEIGLQDVLDDAERCAVERDALRCVASAAQDACQCIEEWFGQASTRNAAMDSLHRLRRALERAGYGLKRECLGWRGEVLKAMEACGIGCDDQGEIRLRLRTDERWKPPGGIPVRQVVREWRELQTKPKEPKP